MGLRTLFRKWVKNINKEKDNQLVLKEWERNGKPVPPPHLVKQQTINEYREKFKIEHLVETGTYMGDMVEAQRKKFKEIVSIELDKTLFNNAVKKFKRHKHIKLFQGDSGEVLQTIVKTINTPTLFWLDGHYSAGNTAKGELNTPIIKELKCILEKNLGHVILIDDAREFIGAGDYPTLHEIKEFVLHLSPGYKMEVKDDIIRLCK